jgi:hypothetical protein
MCVFFKKTTITQIQFTYLYLIQVYRHLHSSCRSDSFLRGGKGDDFVGIIATHKPDYFTKNVRRILFNFLFCVYFPENYEGENVLIKAVIQKPLIVFTTANNDIAGDL